MTYIVTCKCGKLHESADSLKSAEVLADAHEVSRGTFRPYQHDARIAPSLN